MKKQGTYNQNGEKWCSRCEDYHPLVDFGNLHSSPDGKAWMCRYSRSPYFRQDRNTTDKEILRLTMPALKMSSEWFYKRPDAWDNHLTLTIKNVIL